jgi:methylase of polypeptide subunit release factors
LRPGGALVLEVAAGDADRAVSLLAELRYVDVRTTRDLAGRDRVVDAVTTSGTLRDYN